MLIPDWLPSPGQKFSEKAESKPECWVVKMSGPRPRMGSYYMMFKIHAPQLLCQKCDPQPGWGWRIDDPLQRRPGVHMSGSSLPMSGNGYIVDGQCKHCDGVGVDKMGRMNAGMPDKLGMGGWCFECNGAGTAFTYAPGKTHYTFDADGKSDAVHMPCERCGGTGRDAIPWAELFSEGGV